MKIESNSVFATKLLRRLLSSLVFACAMSAGLMAAAQGGGGGAGAAQPGLALQFTVPPQTVTVSVAGTVRDKASGAPLARAQVRAHLMVWRYQGPEQFERCPYLETVTDANGAYQIAFATPLTTTGPMQGKDGLCVYASAPGYESQPRYAGPDVTVRNTTFANFDFQLAAGKPLRGVVVDPAGQPVRGALVRVQNGMNGDWNFFGALGRTLTGDDGAFQLWLGAGSDYLGKNPWVSILKPGTGARVVWGILAKENLETVTLNRGGELAGLVVDARGGPVANCEVSVRAFPFGMLDKTLADSAGKYVLRGIPGEASRREFYQQKNGRYEADWGKVEVHARLNPETSLKDAPHYELAAQDGQTVTGPDLVVGADTSVSGTLLPSKTALSLGGLLVRLDGGWETMVEADLNGRFQFPCVPAGKHTLTAYLPHNLRYDRGIGKTRIQAESGRPLKDVQIQLIDLAEQRVQYLDAQGNPLAGITGSATWSKSGDGTWTEGTVSDNDGWAVLYLYADRAQYVRGFDRAQNLTAEAAKEVNPQPGQLLPPLQIVMVATAKLGGRLLDAQRQPLAAKLALGTLSAADGSVSTQRLKTDANGRFNVERITPGILRLAVELEGRVYPDPLGRTIELRPGQTDDLGDIVLKDGLEKAKTRQ